MAPWRGHSRGRISLDRSNVGPAPARRSPRVLVAQIGARRRYAVPQGLAQTGCLYRLVTDACDAVRPWNHLKRLLPSSLRTAPLQAVLSRHPGAISPEKVQGLFWFFLSTRIGAVRQRRGEARADFWARQNAAFGKAVADLDWGAADTVYAFNGAALEIFKRARHRGLRCVLDQTAAPWRFNTRLLTHEQETWPGWEAQPMDADPSGRTAAREEAEWQLADQIICGSQFVVDAIASVGGPVGKCRVVQYSVPEAPAPIEPGGIQRDQRLRVLFVGTLQLRKGIQYVWETAGRVNDNAFQFRAVGPSNLTPHAEHLVRSRMEWRGAVGREDVWNQFRWADVFLLPTLSEGSANVCWEAIATGTPVITTSVFGEAIPGVTIVGRDSDEIGAHLLKMAHEPHSRRSVAAKPRSMTEYGIDLVRSLE